jgi:hypothetical protein
MLGISTTILFLCLLHAAYPLITLLTPAARLFLFPFRLIFFSFYLFIFLLAYNGGRPRLLHVVARSGLCVTGSW